MRARFIIWRWWSGAQGTSTQEVADLQRGGRAISAIARRAARIGDLVLPAASLRRSCENSSKRLQAIDPDDLAAHYNLAVIYRRMGMKEKAAEQAALFATKQVDPGAPTYSLDFCASIPRFRSRACRGTSTQISLDCRGGKLTLRRVIERIARRFIRSLAALRWCSRLRDVLAMAGQTIAGTNRTQL